MANSQAKQQAQATAVKKDYFVGSKPEHVIAAEEGRRQYWWIDGEPYDLSKFQHRHPGGAVWFFRNHNRDISNLFHTYHSNMAKVQAVLAKYKITDDDSCNKENLFPKLGIPPFLLPDGFNAHDDIPTYDFSDPTHLLPRVRALLDTPEYKTRIERAQYIFDMCFILTIVMYLANMGWWLRGGPTIICTLLMVVGRTWFGAFGHYYVHAKKPNWGECVFDMNYVGSNLTAFDGHVMLHHAYTHTDADIKTSIFAGMWNLPPLLRFPGYTVHKLGQTLTGMILRLFDISFRETNDGTWSFTLTIAWVIRSLIVLEFVCFAMQGMVWEFVIQFTLSIWFNTFLVLSSHDFEDFNKGPAAPRKDWGLYQVENSHDLSMVGNRWLDVLFSAGLSPHRAHHLLPYQTSGFSNIISEDAIKSILPEYGLEWVEAKNFWTERVPFVFRFCFLFPTVGLDPSAGFWEEHMRVQPFVDLAVYMVKGFIGIGSI